MSGIVLSASVRQNLLSLQSTASLLATTQNDLATGNKVNSALDNPTNFFTAQSLNNRASDISNLLDGIGNGVQVLQAANTGITSLQSLVASAQSIANQVLQSPVGYSTKSNVVSAAITGATATNLLGTATSNNHVTGTAVTNDATTGAAAITASTQLVGTAGSTSNDLQTAHHQRLDPDRRRQDHHLLDRADHLEHRRLGQRHHRHRHRQHAEGERRLGRDRQHHRHCGRLLGQRRQARVEHRHRPEPGIGAGTGNALAALGLSAGTTAVTPPPLSGETLTIAATGGGTPTSITFGTGANQVSTLNQLNTALAANNLQASIDSSTRRDHHHDLERCGVLDDRHDQRHGCHGVRRAVQRSAAAAAPVADPNSQATRASLVAQYNNVLAQINTTAQDCVLQRHQPVEWRHAEADVQRNRQVDAEHHRRHLQRCRPRSVDADRGHRLPGQQLGQQGA